MPIILAPRALFTRTIGPRGILIVVARMLFYSCHKCAARVPHPHPHPPCTRTVDMHLVLETLSSRRLKVLNYNSANLLVGYVNAG